VFANTFSNIGWTIAILVFVGSAIAIFINIRRARPEVGSEIELAPNRKPFLDDDALETRHLDRTLFLGLLFLGAVAVALPLYWLYEPARQEGAVEQGQEIAIERGEKVYNVDANCAACHGPEGVGGAKEYTILNDAGEYVDTVSWQAPALNTVLFRYSKEEVLFILEYGRGNTPMPAWGAEGGGALTEQQLTNTVAYLESIQLPADEANTALLAAITEACNPENPESPSPDARCRSNDPASPGGSKSWNTLGEALFNLGYYDGFAGGAYSCGRCHTKGWSYGKAEVSGGGFLGPNLTGGSELRQFDSFDAQVAYVALGSEAGTKYGKGGLSGAGQMPGFAINPNVDEPGSELSPAQTMYTQAQVQAIVHYERGL
jgi:mono/diheme cytochrome c family protein